MHDCSFSHRRGRVFKANRPTTLNIPGPYFKCDTAILLIQHGVDPNMYNLSDCIVELIFENAMQFVSNFKRRK